jgi:hypothetical protein
MLLIERMIADQIGVNPLRLPNQRPMPHNIAGA